MDKKALLSVHTILFGVIALTTVRVKALEIVPLERWSGVFGESKVTFAFRVVGNERVENAANWSYSANGRVIRRGVSRVKGEMLSIELTAPRATDGTVIQTDLTIRIDAGNKDVAKLEKTIWLFPKDPFFERSEWLEKLQIKLFDPKGDTSETFDAAKIPFRRLRDANVLEGVDEGLLVIGEGVSLETNRNLAESVLDVASKGVSVLLLAPANGAFPLPGNDNPDLPSPNRLSFRRNDIIHQLDKRLDSDDWPPDGEVVASGFTIKSEYGRVVAEFSNAENSWPWLEIKYDGRSRLVVCGFGIIKHWEDGPTPRFLLGKLFESLEAKRMK